MGTQPKKLIPGALSDGAPPGPSAELAVKLSLTHPQAPAPPGHPEQPDLLGQGSFIGFANRDPELQEFVHHPKGQYYVFDAPYGYGKTCFLEHVKGVMLNEKNFQCVYINLSRHNSIKEVAIYCARALIGTDLDFDRPGPRGLGLALGAAIATNIIARQQRGVCLLFDVDDASNRDSLGLLQKVIEDFLPAVVDNFQHGVRLIEGTKPGFRIAVAGRYLNSIIRNRFTKPKPKYISRFLKPFDYETVKEVVERVVGDVGTAICADFAADLLFFSSGHPRAIVDILQEYERKRIAPQHFFEECRSEIIETIRPVAQKVSHSIPDHLDSTIRTLCFYRHLNASLLDNLIREGKITGSTDGFQLMKELTTASLAGWWDNFHRVIRDDIVFRMVMWSRVLEKDVDPKPDYEGAYASYRRELERASNDRGLWAINAWYCYLAAKMESIQGASQRESLRHDFFETEVPLLVELLTRDSDPHAEQESLLGVMGDDTEFRFLLNYSLRANGYSEDPYIMMQECIEASFRNASGR